METTLLLDPDILYWVVGPLFVIMVAAGLLRHYVMQLMKNDKQNIPLVAQRAHNCLKQTTKIRSGASHYMTTWKWQVRKQHYAELLQKEAEWCEKEHEKRQESGDAAADNDPMSMMMNNPLSMMKGNMAFMVQNMVMMQFIQIFFSGFILLKVPFPLTVGFKSMFQRGMAELPDLDGSYVSSISWYFLVMYGLRSLFKLVIGEPTLEVKQQEINATSLYGLQNPPPPGNNQDGETVAKQLRQEAENLELFLQQHKSEMDTVEKRLLGKRYPKKSLKRDDDDFLLGAGSKRKPAKESKKKK